MARAIPLKTVQVANGVTGDPQIFVWGEMMRVILKAGNPAKGLTMDEVLICVDAMRPLDEAMETGKDRVTFNENQYQLLRRKLMEFPFGMASNEVAEFCLAIRDAQEIT
jgi:hypothetical protein